ncbi:hypothetical protein DH2020_029273 [Rehmannia glutinosa]|uniref:Oberon PHD finger domain-containing protein n=1 Tax=Rehmannia glutinosa TaxID=99300 RepID=A0ABR0VQT6_REHGL
MKRNHKRGNFKWFEVQPSSENGERTPKRQRKSDQSNRLPIAANGATTSGPDIDSADMVYCKNSACKAKMNREDVFCKRCSCCICRQYDDNKDPSLWLICNSDPPFHGMSCGMSCHLECALRHENSGISKDRQDKGLDGSFCCVSCGKVNDLLGSWRKQLVVARDTRRVDILCYRLSLAQKILAGTKHYQSLCGDIDEAVEKLEEEVGPLTGLPVKKARGIVNRLSSGPEIQRLCASVVESLDLMLSKRVSDTPSVQNGNSENEVQNPNSNSSEVERSQSPATNCSSLSNPSSVEDETNNVSPCGNDDENREDNNTNSSDPSQKETNGDVISLLDEEQINCDAVNFRNKESSNGTENGSNTPRTGLECVPFMNRSEDRLQITPYKMENCKDGVGRKNKRKISGNVIDVIASKRDEEEPQAGSSSKKRSGENRDEKCNGIGDKDFEYYVKVIRWLECDGHIETTFRQKFLTWYSLRATPQEVRIVKVFIDTFIEDPESLAGQLVDTFSDVMSNKRCSTVPSGFCLKLWH